MTVALSVIFFLAHLYKNSKVLSCNMHTRLKHQLVELSISLLHQKRKIVPQIVLPIIRLWNPRHPSPRGIVLDLFVPVHSKWCVFLCHWLRFRFAFIQLQMWHLGGSAAKATRRTATTLATR